MSQVQQFVWLEAGQQPDPNAPDGTTYFRWRAPGDHSQEPLSLGRHS